MSISSELLTLNTTKQNIKTAINLKGVTVNDEPFADYPDKVRLIPSGGGTYTSDIILFIEGGMTHLTVPSGTTKIGNSALSQRDELETISIPNSVTVLESYALAYCQNLDGVVLPSTLTTIGHAAFQYDTGLSSITIPASVTSVDVAAFDGCTGLEYVIFEATVPPTLGANAFQQTNDCPIYVPDESVLAYQTATNYTSYSARIKGISNKPQ